MYSEKQMKMNREKDVKQLCLIAQHTRRNKWGGASFKLRWYTCKRKYRNLMFINVYVQTNNNDNLEKDAW